MARGGFTLVELLVVIVIIIILMGLLTPVLVNVMAKARESRITAEISAMDGAFKAYKERYGSYPPSDFSSATSTTGPVALHLAHCFPRCNIATELTAIPTNSGNPSYLTPAQALVFWLGGFYPDPEHPLSGTGTKTPFFNFDTIRLTPASGAQSFAPIDGLGAPYLYFAAPNYSSSASTYNAAQAVTAGQAAGGTGTGRPYLLDTGVNLPIPYANPNSFQIISAGLDADYGTNPTGVPSFPSGTNYTAGDMDNLSNITEKNLKDAMPH